MKEHRRSLGEDLTVSFDVAICRMVRGLDDLIVSSRLIRRWRTPLHVHTYRTLVAFGFYEEHRTPDTCDGGRRRKTEPVGFTATNLLDLAECQSYDPAIKPHFLYALAEIDDGMRALIDMHDVFFVEDDGAVRSLAGFDGEFFRQDLPGLRFLAVDQDLTFGVVDRGA